MTTSVLVTGSLGYVGSRLTEYLERAGMRCVGYDTGFFRDCILYPPAAIETVRKDVRDLDRSDLRGVDAVVHLAGISNDPLGQMSPEAVYDPTRAYSLRLAELCKELGIRFIFASSCSVYGIGKDGFVTEETETFPQTPYSANKIQIEGDLRAIRDSTFSPVILRFATAYGLSPRMRFDIVVNMLAGMAVTMGKIVLNSDGRAWRPLVHVEDMCKAIRMCIDLEDARGLPAAVNVGDTSENFQIIQVANLVRDQVPGCEIEIMGAAPASASADGAKLFRDRKIQDGVDTRTYRVSFELIEQVLPGFRCDWTVERGIVSMVDRFRELGLSAERFKDVGFYRLQKMESLLSSGALDEQLSWATGARV